MSDSKKPHKNIGGKRTISRLMAIQILYQNNFFNREKNLEEIKNDVIENYALDANHEISSYREKIDEEFLNNLLSGFLLCENEIIPEVSLLLKDGFSLEKMDDVLKYLILLGAFEIKLMSDIPPKVIINEYVDIAASFVDAKKVTFVNGLLENLAKKFRAEEMIKNKKPSQND